MRNNYHTHTFRCYHATGTEWQYVESAWRRGIETLGFSDHAPLPFPDGHQSTCRMKISLFPDYIETLLDLRERYRGRVDILIGLEAEYYPAVFPDFLELIRPYPIDYLILGQHFLGNETGMPYVGEPTEAEGRLSDYVDQVIEGMKTGVFSYLAHPDVAHFTGEADIYRKHMTRLCVAAKELGLPLEYNLLGLYEHRYYPTPAFWEIAKEVGNTVILGVDAHSPAQMAEPATVAQAKRELAALGLVPIENLPLRPIFR